MVTSRVRLRLSLEREYPVLPPELVKEDRPTVLESGAGSDAVRLFVERAQAVKVDFVLTD